MIKAIKKYNSDLFEYLNSSPTPFHAVGSMRSKLAKAGMTELYENQPWSLESGKSYFVIRENSALIAFTLGSNENRSDGFRMIATHGDSPCLQVKPAAGVSSPPYLQLGVEVYGGPLLNQWFDRDLSLAGRVCCATSTDSFSEYLIDFSRPLLTIPSLAIHLDREANEGRPFDKQKFLPPLLAQTFTGQLPDFHKILEKQLSSQYPEADIVDILGFDLFCYDFHPAAYIGSDNEFIAGGRLDNLLSCHAAVTALCKAETETNALFICTNHEENGSTSTTGAHSSFITDIFGRICSDPEQKQIALRNSFLISVDNAHATHPNFKEKSDPNHNVELNGGPVIKVNANQRYASNSRTSARLKLLAKKANVPVQEFVMRSDMPCGSTVGPMTAAKLGVETIDIGAPTFSMHSIRELTGSKDPYLLHEIISEFLK